MLQIQTNGGKLHAVADSVVKTKDDEGDAKYLEHGLCWWW